LLFGKGDAHSLCFGGSQVFLMERLYMRRELYFSIMLDRKSNGPVIVASTQGGTSIEDVAARTPGAIIKVGCPAIAPPFLCYDPFCPGPG
jgi:succinyl-CoA synthetase beta subunit